jgi:hypothetical protein
MKTRKMIFTHAAVFAAGVSLAVVAHRTNVTQPDAGGGDPVRVGSSRSAATGDAAAVSHSMTHREGQNRTTRASEPVAHRLVGIVRIADPLERQSALIDLIGRLGPGEFAAVAEQFRSLDQFGNSNGEYDLIMRGWAAVDPLAALKYTAKQPNSRAATAVILSAWAGKDAAAAERWALDHHKGDGPNPYLTAVIRGIAPNDIAGASRLAESMPYGRERLEAVDAITHALFMQGVDAAMAYPSSIKDSQLRAGFVASIAARLAAKDSKQAAAWVSGIADGESQSRAARSVAEAMANQDPAAAANWLRQLSPEARAEAARGIIPIMSKGDIAGTASWVSTLAGIPNYDRVVEEFVWSCDYRDPEQSAAWIQGIADPEQQTRLYHRMLGEWARRDAGAVKTWVSSNQVPSSVLRRFTQ